MQREMKSVNNIFGDFLVKSGLYDEIEITEDNIFELADLIGGHVKIESFVLNVRKVECFLVRCSHIFGMMKVVEK